MKEYFFKMLYSQNGNGENNKRIKRNFTLIIINI